MRLNRWVTGMVFIAGIATTASVLAEENNKASNLTVPTQVTFYKFPNLPAESTISSFVFLNQGSHVDLWSCLGPNLGGSLPEPTQDVGTFINKYCGPAWGASKAHKIYSQETNTRYIFTAQDVGDAIVFSGKAGLLAASNTITLSLKNPDVLIITTAGVVHVENEAPNILTDHYAFIKDLKATVTLPPLKTKTVVLPAPAP